jgi:hypothetical protein
MSQKSPYAMDLSGLPPEIRQKVEERLAALTPEVRERWEKSGVVKLARLFGGGLAPGQSQPPPLPGASQGPAWRKDSGAGTASRPGVPTPKAAWRTSQELLANTRREAQGHYNDTIRPGDNPGLLRWVFVVGLVLAAVALVYW